MINRRQQRCIQAVPDACLRAGNAFNYHSVIPDSEIQPRKWCSAQ
jgi:hypothetical protein